jgi:hypothetical protein
MDEKLSLMQRKAEIESYKIQMRLAQQSYEKSKSIALYQKNVKDLEKTIYDLLHSRSMRITKPLRFATRSLKYTRNTLSDFYRLLSEKPYLISPLCKDYDHYRKHGIKGLMSRIIRSTESQN